MDPRSRATYLSKAANVLEREGWCQGDLHKPGEGHCAVGAIAVATGYHYAPGGRFHASVVTQDTVFHDVLDAMSRYVGLYNVTLWNDIPGRTKEQVVEALRDAAAIQNAAALR